MGTTPLASPISQVLAWTRPDTLSRYLISDRRAAGLGIDTHGLEPGAANGYPVNSLVLERPRLALENLTNLDRAPPTGATIVIGILRLEGGSGSPVSVLAFVP